MKNNQDFFKYVFNTIISKLFLIVLKLSLSVITARLLGPTGRGVFYATIQLAGFSSTLGSISLYDSFTYYISNGKLKIERILFAVVLYTVVLSILILMILLLIWDFIASNLLTQNQEFIKTIVFLLIPTLLLELFSGSALKGLKEFYILNKINILTKCILLIFVSLSLYFVEVSVVVTLTSYVIATIINSCIYFCILFYKTKPDGKFDLNITLPILRYGSSLHLGNVLLETEYRIDVFILLYFLSATAVGIYSIGTMLAQIIWYISNSVNTVLFPFLSYNINKENKINLLIMTTKYTLLISIIVILSLVFSGEFLIDFFFGNEYEDAYYVFLILSIGIIFDVFAKSLVVWIKSINQPFVVTKISFITLFINIVSNIILIPLFGIYGAAISSSISYGLRSLIYLIYFIKQTHISPILFFHVGDEDKRNILIGINILKNKFRNK